MGYSGGGYWEALLKGYYWQYVIYKIEEASRLLSREKKLDSRENARRDPGNNDPEPPIERWAIRD
jgi:hypothetical protein